LFLSPHALIYSPDRSHPPRPERRSQGSDAVPRVLETTVRKTRNRSLGAALCAALVLAVRLPAFAAGSTPSCSFQVGDRVVLTADTVDPNVFVWDSRPRLIEYVAGSWASTKDVFGHTTLVDPGTLAVVIGCHPHEAHPQYEPTDEDVIGVRIVTGRHHNLWGWVVSSDAHELRN
jgi:hypothetical protein